VARDSLVREDMIVLYVDFLGTGSFGFPEQSYPANGRRLVGKKG
jgi:hypothetical protein